MLSSRWNTNGFDPPWWLNDNLSWFALLMTTLFYTNNNVKWKWTAKPYDRRKLFELKIRNMYVATFSSYVP